MDNNQLEIKIITAVTMFAMKLNKMADKLVGEMAEAISDQIDANADISVEEITQEIAKQFISSLSKEFKLGGAENETKS